MKAEAFGVRVVCLRTGIVLSTKGGALAKMLPLFRLGLGGPLGGGRQWMSWIHIEDEARAIVHAIEDETLRGPVNLTAPSPVRMSDFSSQLGKAVHRPALLPAPAFALKIFLGEMSSLLLDSQNVNPRVLINHNFHFNYPQLEPALKALLT
jgi:uncharacterized protein